MTIVSQRYCENSKFYYEKSQVYNKIFLTLANCDKLYLTLIY